MDVWNGSIWTEYPRNTATENDGVWWVLSIGFGAVANSGNMHCVAFQLKQDAVVTCTKSPGFSPSTMEGLDVARGA